MQRKRPDLLQMSRQSRNVVPVLLGVAGLVLKGQYSGPYRDLVHSYGGNLAASFAAYFLATRVTMRSNHSRALAVGLSVAVVELFEVCDGFGVMSNVYDRVDLAANAVGIALALALDALMERISSGKSNRRKRLGT